MSQQVTWGCSEKPHRRTPSPPLIHKPLIDQGLFLCATRQVSHFLGVTCLAPAFAPRHGAFHFRLTFRIAGATREKRISLRTKNPQEARFKTLCLLGTMAVRKQEQQRAISMDYLNRAVANLLTDIAVALYESLS